MATLQTTERSEVREEWEQDCLAQWNERHGDRRKFIAGHAIPADEPVVPDEIIEFRDNGDVYLHEKAGRRCVPQAVTPFARFRAV